MFSKKPAEPIRPAPPQGKSMPSNNSTFSVIGSDVAIKGYVTASADLHVDGTSEGDLKCASLVQGETCLGTGGFSAESARLSGMLSVSITAR